MSNELSVIEVNESAVTKLGAISPMMVVEQVKLVQQVMGSVMRQDEHYGIIPGTQKNCLFKSGAEKLCFTFQLTPEFEVREKELPGGHREITVTCHLINASGRRMGTGVGCCSTMESKYRYRGAELIATGETVPSAYWNVRKEDSSRAQDLIGKGRVTKKDEDGVWRIYEKGQKAENPDIADVYNTVLKMAKKRAHVDATITATACSDIFTQDVDDLPPTFDPSAVPPAAPAPATAKTPAQPAAQAQQKPAPPQRQAQKPAPAEGEFTPVDKSPAAQTSQPAGGRGQPQPAEPAKQPAQTQATKSRISDAVQELLDTPSPEDVAKQRQLMTKLGLEIANRSKDDAEALKADWRNAANAQMRLVLIEKAKTVLRELCA